jgi:hypothetical protein
MGSQGTMRIRFIEAKEEGNRKATPEDMEREKPRKEGGRKSQPAFDRSYKGW